MSKWTKEKCHEEALKYNNRTDFRKNSRGAYNYSYNNNILDDVCSHMNTKKCKPMNYWNKINCKYIALKYINICDFRENDNVAYVTSCRKKWLNDITKHMDLSTNNKDRCIYIYEFEDNKVYIGLTYNFKRRHAKHMKDIDSVVFKNKDKIINFYQLTDYINVDIAKEKEQYYIDLYKQNYNVLNKQKGGGIGSNILYWTKERCKEEALKYSNITDFYKKSYSAYQSIIKNNWKVDTCSHIPETRKPRGYWTKEKCHEEALKYKYRNKFKINSRSAYTKAQKNKWLDEMCSHMN